MLADEPLLEISTDKVDTEVPAPAAGVLGGIVVPEGETVTVGTVLATIVPEGAAAPAPRAARGPAEQTLAPEPPAPEPATAATPADDAGEGTDAAAAGRSCLRVARIAAEHDVDVSLVPAPAGAAA